MCCESCNTQLNTKHSETENTERHRQSYITWGESCFDRPNKTKCGSSIITNQRLNVFSTALLVYEGNSVVWQEYLQKSREKQEQEWPLPTSLCRLKGRKLEPSWRSYQDWSSLPTSSFQTFLFPLAWLYCRPEWDRPTFNNKKVQYLQSTIHNVASQQEVWHCTQCCQMGNVKVSHPQLEMILPWRKIIVHYQHTVWRSSGPGRKEQGRARRVIHNACNQLPSH